jgi:hypothetical protein
MWLLLYKVLNEFVDSGISMDSNKLVEKFGMILLLTRCHYPEPNPGPRTPKFPCGVCQKAVKTIDQGIMCDNLQYLVSHKRRSMCFSS